MSASCFISSERFVESCFTEPLLSYRLKLICYLIYLPLSVKMVSFDRPSCCWLASDGARFRKVSFLKMLVGGLLKYR